MYSETRERALLSRVFFNMTWALALTALVAYGVANYRPDQRDHQQFLFSDHPAHL
jgi:FtsH-binding integral membrane protein